MLLPVKQLVVSSILTGWAKCSVTTSFRSRRNSSLGSRDEQSDLKEDKRQEDVEELESDLQHVSNSCSLWSFLLPIAGG